MKEKFCMAAEDFRERYENGISNESNVLYMLQNCGGDVGKVSKAMDWGISYAELIDLCAGYVYGTRAMKRKVLDFLDDINFHYESSELGSRFYRDCFIRNVLDHNSDYVKEYWSYVR